MLNMKTASIRDVQHNLADVLEWVERGEEVHIYRRKKLVARLLPPASSQPVEFPDFVARARKIWGEKPKGKPLSEILSDSRGER
jgi:antitoxin (DNA-binding transcriptional repressor) of toxin-antitoxin stability system